MELYNGSVLVKFNAGNHRYTISQDQGKTWDYKPGVTSILGVLSKPALMLWPMDEALKYLFGQKFEEITQDSGDILVKPLYSQSDAFIKTDQPYSLLQLQNALEQARAAHTVKRDKGGDVGHEVHKLIEEYLTPSELAVPLVHLDGYSKEAIKAYSAFVRWFEDQNIKVLATEQVVYSKAFDYCGTYDALFEIDGKKVLVDFKTSNYSRTAPKGIYPEGFLQLGAYALAYEEEFGEDTIDDLLIINASKQGKVNTQYASELGYLPTQLMTLFSKAFSLYQGKSDLERKLKGIK